jgi:hypothetical protein
MNEIERKDEIPSTSKLSKLGITAIGYSAGGIFLFILQAVARFRVFGLIAGAVVCLVGIGSLLSKDPADRKAGVIITTAGVLAVLSKSGIPGVMQVTGTLLAIGAVGLLALGIWNGIKFFIGLKKRS